MKREDRKAAIAAYKERGTVAGIYALRCAPTGQCWVGRAPDMEKIRNRLWFTLGMGNNPHRALQAAWREHGADAFSFEELERLDEDTAEISRARILKDRLAHWRERLDAAAI